jgi:hypothetical protein
MTAVALTIVQPADGTVFHQGETQVRLVGRVGPLPPELAGTPLHYRWYSSLFPSQENRYSLNPVALGDPATPFDAPLGPGSHAITLAASDQAGETKSAQNAARHGGVAGGAAGAGKCIIHLLRAVLVTPAAAGAALSKAASTLEAEAPLQWGRQLGTTGTYEPNPDYHSLNRLRYRWRFAPVPADGRATATLDPPASALTFVPPGARPLVRYQGPLPAALGLGSYTLTLQVEDTGDASVGHEVSRPVTITA